MQPMYVSFGRGENIGVVVEIPLAEEVWKVWGAYHERERLCPEGVRVVEIAHVHYGSRRR